MTRQRPQQRRTDTKKLRSSAGLAAEMLKLLANEQRLLVLCLLAEGERSVGEINEEITLSQSALSQHLAKLRAQGLVTTRREAQTIYYQLPPGPARRLVGALYEIYCGKGSG